MRPVVMNKDCLVCNAKFDQLCNDLSAMCLLAAVFVVIEVDGTTVPEIRSQNLCFKHRRNVADIERAIMESRKHS